MSITDTTAATAEAPADANTVSKPARDDFWDQAEIQGTSWNQKFPYQLVILKTNKANAYQIQGGAFTLPIGPQALTISTPFAVTGSVTLGGYVEEHNGAPIRMISLQGTTGILPQRGSALGAKKMDLAGAIFGGTLSGFRRIEAGVATAASGGQALFQPNLVDEGSLTQTTGYFQFMLLRNFLEQYANNKKAKNGQDLRLGLAVWKDREIYLVTPVSFDLSRNAQSPLEYNYSLQLRAWRRWDPGASKKPGALGKRPIVRDPNDMAAMLSRVTATRSILQGMKSTLEGFRSDIDTVLFTPVRELAFTVKDALGLGMTAMDLPVNIIRDMKDAIILAASTIIDFEALKSQASNFGPNASKQIDDLVSGLTDLADLTGASQNQTGPDSVNVGQSQRGAQVPLTLPSPYANTSPLLGIFDDVDRFGFFFSSIKIGSLQLRPHSVKAILLERMRVRNLKRLDWEKKRDALVAFTAGYSDSVGAGNETYSRIYGTPISASTRTPTDDDWDVIFHLNQVILELNHLVASTAVDDRTILTAMEYIAGQASAAGVPFQVPASSYTVPFPYGSTLEVLAGRYLGDVDRWMELAVLNNLRAPWVDEEGFYLSLLVNGVGNTLQVNSVSNLTPGQLVWVSSDTQSRRKRRITSIRTLSTTVHLVVVDGDADMADMTVAARANIYTFLPGTINSLQLIYIPSATTVDPTLEPKSNPAVDEFDNFLQVGGTDLLLTESGDLAIDRNGNCRLAIGLANITQKVRLALSTPLGSLMRHPGYGFGIMAGTSTADVSAQDILAAAKSTFAGDPTFTGIVSASVIKSGPSISIGMNVGVAGASQLVPITFKMRGR